MRPLSPAEARKLLEAAQGEGFEGLYVLTITTGMRLGELLVLKLQDVELENATVSVRRTLTRTGGRYTLGELKTKIYLQGPIFLSGRCWVRTSDLLLVS